MRYKLTITAALIAFVLSITACKKDDDVYAAGNPDATPTSTLLSIKSVSKTSIEADTASITTIEAAILPETDSNARAVIFSTTLGNFKNGKTSDTVKANAYGIAVTNLLSNTAGTAKISLRVKSVMVDTTVTFTQALPDDMLMTADRYVGDSAASFTIFNPLFRNPGRGKPTDPVKVFYTITPIGAALPVLVYPPFAFSINRQASIVITNPQKVKGEYIVEAQTISANGSTLRRTVTIKIQ
jgi:hypothetical protein